MDPGEDLGDPEVGLVLILLPLLLPSCKVLPGVKEGMIGVLFDGFKLDLLFPTTLFDLMETLLFVLLVKRTFMLPFSCMVTRP